MISLRIHLETVFLIEKSFYRMKRKILKDYNLLQVRSLMSIRWNWEVFWVTKLTVSHNSVVNYFLITTKLTVPSQSISEENPRKVFRCKTKSTSEPFKTMARAPLYIQQCDLHRTFRHCSNVVRKLISAPTPSPIRQCPGNPPRALFKFKPINWKNRNEKLSASSTGVPVIKLASADNERLAGI